MRPELIESTVVARAASISWCDMGEEVVVLRVKDQAYYRLKSSARILWLQLEQPQRLSGLVAAMQGGYEGATADIIGQTKEFLQECAELELVTLEHEST